MFNIDPATLAIPFFMATTAQGEHKLNVTRIIEALIIAGVVGGIVLYGNHKMTSAEMRHLRVDVTEGNEIIKQVQSDVVDLTREFDKHDHK